MTNEFDLVRVLLIEDNPEYAFGLQQRLLTYPFGKFNLISVDNLTAGLSHIEKGEADIVLLDLTLPESQGLATYERISAMAPEIPVVIITALEDDAMALEAVRHGAQDFVVKGQVDSRLLVRIIRYAIERHRMQAALRSLSMLDELTGLYNRRGFLRLAEQHLKLASRTVRGSILLFMDLDGLKAINDTFGHQEGDVALKATAEVLKNAFRSSDVLARIGGDEFSVMAIEASRQSLELIRSRLKEKVTTANAKNRWPFKLSLSIGMAYIDPAKRSSLEHLMAEADKDAYQQKSQARKA